VEGWSGVLGPGAALMAPTRHGRASGPGRRSTPTGGSRSPARFAPERPGAGARRSGCDGLGRPWSARNGLLLGGLISGGNIGRRSRGLIDSYRGLLADRRLAPVRPGRCLRIADSRSLYCADVRKNVSYSVL